MNNRIIAITGPSGVGKTTLSKYLSFNLGIEIPSHCTTRKERKDDIIGFYRYLSHEEFRLKSENNEFLLYSGDGPYISKEYGNFYGVLKEDCLAAWKKNDIIILFVSYKDIFSLMDLKSKGFNIDIVNLLYTNLESGIKDRLMDNKERDHSIEDIERRIMVAKQDSSKYGELVGKNSATTIYTDVISVEKTYEKVCCDLCLKKIY